MPPNDDLHENRDAQHPLSRPEEKKSIGSWIIGVAVLLMLAYCGGFAGIGWWIRSNHVPSSIDSSPQSDKSRLSTPSRDQRFFERKELEAKLSQATAKEVRALLGDPADVAQPVVGLPDDPNEDVWMYHNKTRDPETGGPDPDLLIRFRFGRVYLVVCTPLRALPR